MTDINKYAEFYQLQDWEGGLAEVVMHGHDGSGDDQLDLLLEELEVVLTKCYRRMSEIESEYGDQIRAIDN